MLELFRTLLALLIFFKTKTYIQMEVVVRRMLTAFSTTMERTILAKKTRPSQVTPVRIGTPRLPTNIVLVVWGTTTTAETLMENEPHGATPQTDQDGSIATSGCVGTVIQVRFWISQPRYDL